MRPPLDHFLHEGLSKRPPSAECAFPRLSFQVPLERANSCTVALHAELSALFQQRKNSNNFTDRKTVKRRAI